MLRAPEIKLIKSDAISAVQKESIEKPGVICCASRSSSAFRTKENSPSVTMVIGKVKRERIGLTVMLIMPIINTAKIAAVQLLITNPGNIYVRINSVMVFTMNHLSMILNLVKPF